jgi:hypothetical protein
MSSLGDKMYAYSKWKSQFELDHPVISTINNILKLTNPLSTVNSTVSGIYDMVEGVPRQKREATQSWEKQIGYRTGMDVNADTFRDEFDTYIRDAQKLGYLDGQTTKDGLAAYTKYRNNGYNIKALSDKDQENLRKLYGVLWNQGNPKFASYYNKFTKDMTPDQIRDFINGLGSELSSMGIPAPDYLKADFENYQREVDPLKWYTNQELADLLNIDYDFNNIKNELDTAAQAGVDYANWKSDLLANTAERDNAQGITSYLDAIRNTKSQAIQKGVTNGARAAAEYLATMDTINSKGQSELQTAKDREAAVNDALLERAQTEINALNTYDKLSQMFSNASTTLYANDVERKGADTLANSNFYSADENTRANFLGANAKMAGMYDYANAANQPYLNQAGQVYDYFKDISMPANGNDFYKALSDYINLAYSQSSGYQSLADKWGAMSQYGNK